ncbi:MAG: Mth938-like domain-containing protein [Candidatus Aminicenantales bacterium]
MIESYVFGRMVIGGKTYTSDLIIFPDKIQESWWRKSGHRLCIADVEHVFKAEPEAFVIGTGFTGLMKVEDEVRKKAQSEGILLIVEKTKKAVQRFNETYSQKKTVGAFHLTC